MKLQIAVNPRLRFHLSPLVWILLTLMGIAFIVAMIRYIYGIGAISNLSSAYPWGFWISFDLLTGVAIASGGFIMAGMVEIFELNEFRPLLYPALLTGFLGYILYILALLVDLGHPERIWHYVIFQNHHSVLFECGILVMIITATFALIFAPLFFERMNQPKVAKIFRDANKPLIILLVTASILHQTSLGSIYLIQNPKLSPLWWTPVIPLHFFISAVAIGLAMTIFESSLSSRYFHRGLETHLLEKLAVAIPYVLGLYLIVRFTQLALAGDLQYLFNSGIMSILFWSEIIIGSIIPLIMFAFKKIRQSPRGLLTGAIILLLGMILNRFDVSWLAIKHPDPLTYIPTFMANNVHYLPSLPEISISLGIFSAGILAFGLAIKYLPIFEDEDGHHSSPSH